MSAIIEISVAIYIMSEKKNIIAVGLLALNMLLQALGLWWVVA